MTHNNFNPFFSNKKRSEFEQINGDTLHTISNFNTAKANIKKMREELEHKLRQNKQENDTITSKLLEKPGPEKLLEGKNPANSNPEVSEKEIDHSKHKINEMQQEIESGYSDTTSQYDFVHNYKDNVEKSFLELMKKQQYIEQHSTRIDSKYNNLIKKQKNISQLVKKKKMEYSFLLNKEKKLEQLRLQYASDYNDLEQKCIKLEDLVSRLDNDEKKLKSRIYGMKEHTQQKKKVNISSKKNNVKSDGLIDIRKLQEIIKNLNKELEKTDHNIESLKIQKAMKQIERSALQQIEKKK